jgi:hypothetical protein
MNVENLCIGYFFLISRMKFQGSNSASPSHCRPLYVLRMLKLKSCHSQDYWHEHERMSKIYVTLYTCIMYKKMPRNSNGKLTALNFLILIPFSHPSFHPSIHSLTYHAPETK